MFMMSIPLSVGLFNAYGLGALSGGVQPPLPSGSSTCATQGQGLFAFMEFRCDQQVSLHPRNGESLYAHGVAFSQKQTALFQESHRGKTDQLGLPGRLHMNLKHAAVGCCARQVDDLCY